MNWRIQKYNLFREVFRFHNSKEAVVNLAKYIDADIFAKQFINFGKQIIFLNSLAHKL